MKAVLTTTLVSTMAILMVVACAKNDSNNVGAPIKAPAAPGNPGQPLPGTGEKVQLKTPKDDAPNPSAGSAPEDGDNTPAPRPASGGKLMDQVTAKMDALTTDAAQTLKNQTFAKSLIAVQSKLVDGEFKVRVTGKNKMVQHLIGTYNDGSAALTAKDSNSDMQAFLTCEDQDQAAHQCKVGLVDLKAKDGSEALALVRHTNATMTLNTAQQPKSASADYQTLNGIFASTIARTAATSNVRTILFNSSEIAYGSTYVHISFVTGDNQVIGLAGTVKFPAAGLPFTEGALDKNIRDVDVSDFIPDAQNIKEDLQKLIQGAQILKVEGSSDFTLLIDVKGTDTEPRQTISLKLTRTEVPAGQDLK